MNAKYVLILVLISFLGCKETEPAIYNATEQEFHYNGRYEILENGAVALISSAASVEFNVKGKFLNLSIQSDSDSRNYFVLAINDEYQKRYAIKGDSIQTFQIELPETNQNKIGIFKATEAFAGSIIFHGAEAKAITPVKNKTFNVEFIGDSITCGALADSTDVSCDAEEYIDNHNAYLAYGPLVAKNLDANFILSSVSGIGIYRNWNDENIEELIMPQVYENLYLNEDASKPFNFTTQPDLVSICLGTNDLSEGDGVKKRLPFNSDKFINNYIQFIKTVYNHYPNTKIVLLNSPMKDGKENDTLLSCLNKVKSHFKEKNIAIFQFDKLFVSGCRYHPSLEDHKEMANQLTPIIKKILNQHHE